MNLGIDISSYLEEVSHGAHYFQRGQEIDLLEAFHKNGVDSLRARLWNDPQDEAGVSYQGGSCDLAHLLRLGRLAKKKGYSLVIDFHYSDFWTDPGKQSKPKAWANLSKEELVKALYSYTKDTLLVLKEEGLPVEAVQLGNEITNGLLWPEGLLQGSVPTRTNYESVAVFLKAGAQAVKEAFPAAKIILHLEKSGDLQTYREFFDQMTTLQVPYDVIGLSYYPYWHGEREGLYRNIDSLQARYHKEIRIMEFSYAFGTTDYLPGGKDQLVINPDSIQRLAYPLPYPLTPEGQASFVKHFLEEAEKHQVAGVYYWEPAWIPVAGVGWASSPGQAYIRAQRKDSRNEWANQCLFDYQGETTLAFAEFAKKQ
jgi:arabinogalactan endo-1,4-beta-galactosidase